MARGYRVTGDGPYAVVDSMGGTIYDLIDEKQEAKLIKKFLNMGLGPDWDSIQHLVKP